MVAVARASLREMEVLLDHGARLNIRDAFGQTAETFAEIFGQIQSRRTIIKFKWKKRNEQSMIRERETKIALSKQGTEEEQALEKSNRQREERLVQLSAQRKKRQEQLAAQKSRLGKKRSKTQVVPDGFTPTLHSTDPQAQANSQTSAVKAEDGDNEHDSESLERSPERTSPNDSSTSPTATQRSTKPTQKLYSHQFYDVYAGMTDEEWSTVRNAFVAQYFSE